MTSEQVRRYVLSGLKKRVFTTDDICNHFIKYSRKQVGGSVSSLITRGLIEKLPFHESRGNNYFKIL